MVDWTELGRLYEAFACTYHPITEDNPEYDRLCGALARSFPAILAERREMLAKLEAAQRLIQAPYLDYGREVVMPDVEGKSWFEAARDWSAAFDKEQTA